MGDIQACSSLPVFRMTICRHALKSFSTAGFCKVIGGAGDYFVPLYSVVSI